MRCKQVKIVFGLMEQASNPREFDRRAASQVFPIMMAEEDAENDQWPETEDDSSKDPEDNP